MTHSLYGSARLAPQGRPPPCLRWNARSVSTGRGRQNSQPVALAWPASRAEKAESADKSNGSAATAILSKSSKGAYADGTVSADSSIDEAFSPKAVEAAAVRVDEAELRARIAELAMEKDVEPDSDEGGGSGGRFGISASLRGMLLLNLGAALFGSNMVAIKAAEDSMSSTALSAMRFGIAALAFAPYVVRGLRIPAVRRNAAELAMWLFGGYTAQATGLEMTTAARGAFTGTFTVVAVPLLVGLSGRRVSWTTWVAAVTAIIGVGMLTSSGGDPTWGDALCILSATLFGVHKYRSEIITAEVEETTELIAVQLAGLAAASLLVTAPEMWNAVHGHELADVFANFAGLPWAALLFMGLGTTALTLWIEMNALKDVSAPVAAIIYSAEPLWGAGLAYFLLGERWGALGWAGAALIVASSLGAQLGGQSEKVADKEKGA